MVFKYIFAALAATPGLTPASSLAPMQTIGPAPEPAGAALKRTRARARSLPPTEEPQVVSPPRGRLGRARGRVRRLREVDLLPPRRQQGRVCAGAAHAVGADPRQEVDVGVGAAVAAKASKANQSPKS